MTPMTDEAMERARAMFKEQEPPKQTDGNKARLDVSAYLDHYQRAYTVKTVTAGTLYGLMDGCLFDQGHKDAGILQTATGSLLYECFHDSCQGHTWQEARKILSGDDKLAAFMKSGGRATADEGQAQQGAGNVLRAVGVAEFLSYEFPPRETMLDPWLPVQGLVMIHAPRGVGKTLVGIGVAVAVASGGDYLRWHASKPRGALYIDGEMPGVLFQQRLAMAINGSKTEPTAPLKIITPDLQENGIPDLSTKEGQAAIEPELDSVSLVVVDNLSCLCRSGKENEGESWLPLQGWALGLRSRGYSVMFIHHDGKGGQQRGTSRREDVLDTVVHLKHPGDYRPEEGARFEVHFEKARMIYGDDVKPFETQLITNPDGTQIWTMKDVETSLMERVADLLNEGIPQHELADLLNVTKGAISKAKNKAKSQGILKEKK